MVAAATFVWLLVASSYVFNWGNFFRPMLVSGSHARYVLTTLVWAAMLPANVWMVIYLIIPPESAPTWAKIVIAGGTLYTDWSIWHSDDDNYWRRKRKRLAKKIRARLTAMRLSPIGVSS